MVKVGDQMHPWHEGMTVSELLATLQDPYPYVVVRIDDQYVSRPHFNHTVIPDGAEIFLVPMIAGG